MDRRARVLPADYKSKLTAIDRQCYNIARGVTGPLVLKLEFFGKLLCLVLGAFGEVSEDMERSIKAIAESRGVFIFRGNREPGL